MKKIATKYIKLSQRITSDKRQTRPNSSIMVSWGGNRYLAYCWKNRKGIAALGLRQDIYHSNIQQTVHLPLGMTRNVDQEKTYRHEIVRSELRKENYTLSERLFLALKSPLIIMSFQSSVVFVVGCESSMVCWI